MFDQIHIRPGSSHSTHESQIHEHRAPTDESVRLLSEMERAAEKKLISVTRLESNTLHATWHLFEDMFNRQLRAECRLDLNGEIHNLTIVIDCGLRYNPDGIARKICDEVKEEISKIITYELFEKHSQDMRQLMR